MKKLFFLLLCSSSLSFASTTKMKASDTSSLMTALVSYATSLSSTNIVLKDLQCEKNENLLGTNVSDVKYGVLTFGCFYKTSESGKNYVEIDTSTSKLLWNALNTYSQESDSGMGGKEMISFSKVNCNIDTNTEDLSSRFKCTVTK